MPEAVASNSISVPEIQPDLFLIATDFEEIGQMFASLAESACLAFDAEALSDNFSIGMDNMFRHVMARFNEATEALYEGADVVRRELDFKHTYATQMAAFEKQVDEINTKMQEKESAGEKRLRLFFPQGDEVFFMLKDKLITIAENAYRDSGGLIHEIAARKIAGDYARQIIDRTEGEDDLLEAGSFLPWAELEIRKDVAQRIADKQIVSQDVV